MSESVRELFIEELEDVHGGAPAPDTSVDTTLMCCEELIWDRCCL